MAETEVTTVQDYRLSKTEALVKRQIERVEKMLEEQMAKTAALVEKQLERARSFLQQKHEQLKEKNQDCNQTNLLTPTMVIAEVYTNTIKSTQTSSHGHMSTEDVTEPCSIKRRPLEGETVLPGPCPQDTPTVLLSPLQTGEMCQLTSKSEKMTPDSDSMEWVCRQCNATNQLQLTDMHENRKQDNSEKNVSEIDNQRQSVRYNVISRSQKSLDCGSVLLANKEPTSSLADHTNQHTNQQKHQLVKEEDFLSNCNEISSTHDIAEYSFKEDTVENSIDQANCPSVLQGNITDKKIKSRECDIIAELENSQPCNVSLLIGQNNHSVIHQTGLESRENNYSEQESQIESLQDMKNFISKSTQTTLSFEIIMSEDNNLRKQSYPLSENTLVKQKARKYTPISTSDEDTSNRAIEYDLHSTETNTSPDHVRSKTNLMPEPNQPKSISDDDTLHSNYALALEDSNDAVETKTNNLSQTTVIFNRSFEDSNGSISKYESLVVSLDISVESKANDCITREPSMSPSHHETCSNVNAAVVEADEKKENCVKDILRNQQKPDTAKYIKDYEDVNSLSHHTSTESVSTSAHANQKSLEIGMRQTDESLNKKSEPLHRSETLKVVDNRAADDSNSTLPHDSKESTKNIQQLAEYQQLDNKLTSLNEESSPKTSVSERPTIPPYDTTDKVVFSDESLKISQINELQKTPSTVAEGIIHPNEGAATTPEVFLGYIDPSGIPSGEQIHNQDFEVGIIAESVQRMDDENNSESPHLKGSENNRCDGVVEEVFQAASGEQSADKSTIHDQYDQITITEEHLNNGIFKRETKPKTTQLLLEDSHLSTVTIENCTRDITDDRNDKYVSNIKIKPSKSSISDQSRHPSIDDKQMMDDISETEIIPEVASLLYDDNVPRLIKTQNGSSQFPRDDWGGSANSLEYEEDIKDTTDNQSDIGKEIDESSDSVVNPPSKSSTSDEHAKHVIFESEIIPKTVSLLYMDDKNNPDSIGTKDVDKDISEVDNSDQKRGTCTIEEDIFVQESAALLYIDPTCSNKPIQDDPDAQMFAAIKSHSLTPTDNNQDSSEYSGSTSSPAPLSNSSDVMYELLENNSNNDRNNSHASPSTDFKSYVLLKDSDDEHCEPGVPSDNDSNQNQKHRSDSHITNLETNTVAEFTKTKANVDLPLSKPPRGESTDITDKVNNRSTIDNKLGIRTSEKDNGNLVFRHNLSDTLRNTDLDYKYQHSLHSERSDESGPRILNIEPSESPNRPSGIELGRGPVKEEDTSEPMGESSTEEELDSSFFERERERYVHTTSSTSSSFVFEETDVSSYQRTSGSDHTESRLPNPCEIKPETTSSEQMPFGPKSDKEVCSFCESDISIGREDLGSSIIQFSSINEDTVDGSTEDIVIDETFSSITRTSETNPNNSSKKHSSVRSRDKRKGEISSRETNSSKKDNAKHEYVRKVRARNWKNDPDVSSTDTDPAVQEAEPAFISQCNMGSQLGPRPVSSRHKRAEIESSSYNSSNLSIRSEARDSIDGSEDWTTTDDIESNILQGTAEDSTDIEDTCLNEELAFVDSSEITDTLATSSETITQIANPVYKRS